MRKSKLKKHIELITKDAVYIANYAGKTVNIVEVLQILEQRAPALLLEIGTSICRKDVEELIDKTIKKYSKEFK